MLVWIVDALDGGLVESGCVGWRVEGWGGGWILIVAESAKARSWVWCRWTIAVLETFLLVLFLTPLPPVVFRFFNQVCEDPITTEQRSLDRCAS